MLGHLIITYIVSHPLLLLILLVAADRFVGIFLWLFLGGNGKGE